MKTAKQRFTTRFGSEKEKWMRFLCFVMWCVMMMFCCCCWCCYGAIHVLLLVFFLPQFFFSRLIQIPFKCGIGNPLTSCPDRAVCSWWTESSQKKMKNLPCTAPVVNFPGIIPILVRSLCLIFASNPILITRILNAFIVAFHKRHKKRIENLCIIHLKGEFMKL